MKTNIEQIKIDGKEYNLTLVEPKKEAVNVTTQEQWDFVNKQKGIDGLFLLKCFDKYKTKSAIWLAENKSYSDKKYAKESGYTILTFTEYLEAKGLESEWREYIVGLCKEKYPIGTTYIRVGGSLILEVKGNLLFKTSYGISLITDGHGGSVWEDGKWAEIVEPKKEIELVRGEIYFDEDEIKTCRNVFRFKSGSISFSRIFSDGNRFYLDASMCFYDGNIKPATKKQIKKLIKAELKNGMVWHNGEYLK